MLGYELSMTVSQALKLGLNLSMKIDGGATQSVFPMVEKFLRTGKNMEALRLVSAKKNVEKYKCVIDFLFCELFTQWKNSVPGPILGMKIN